VLDERKKIKYKRQKYKDKIKYKKDPLLGGAGVGFKGKN
jgi:hypothetical protein